MKETIEAFEQIYAIKPPKQLAEEVGTNSWLLYKWMETGESHRTNPVEHVAALTTATRNLALVDCICRKADGVFVPNPAVKGGALVDSATGAGAVFKALWDFGAVLSRMAFHQKISPADARCIRVCWDKLKAAGERFVRMT